MKPSGPIPPYFSAGADGQLLVGNVAAEELVAEAGGTPLFVYDNNIVGAQIARLEGRDARRPRALLFRDVQTLTSHCSISLAGMSMASGSSPRESSTGSSGPSLPEFP